VVVVVAVAFLVAVAVAVLVAVSVAVGRGAASVLKRAVKGVMVDLVPVAVMVVVAAMCHNFHFLLLRLWLSSEQCVIICIFCNACSIG
jgi:hypothetical protein